MIEDYERKPFLFLLIGVVGFVILLQVIFYKGFMNLIFKTLGLSVMWVGVIGAIIFLLKRYVSELYNETMRMFVGHQNTAESETETDEWEEEEDKASSLNIVVGDEGGSGLSDEEITDLGVDDLDITKQSANKEPKKSGSGYERKKDVLLENMEQEDSNTLAKAVRRVMKKDK